MKTLTIIRGLPGSGKTTLAKLVADEVFEADQYFCADGKYQYDPAKIQDAHNDCFVRFSGAVSRGVQSISVSNTSSKKWEFQRYADYAQNNGYKVHVVIVENYHDGKSIHNVPDDTIRRMKDRFEVHL